MKAAEVTTYCIDTSCLIAAWEERYPPENFPKFWDLLDRAITGGLVRAPMAVLDEVEKKSKDLVDYDAKRNGFKQSGFACLFQAL